MLGVVPSDYPTKSHGKCPGNVTLFIEERIRGNRLPFLESKAPRISVNGNVEKSRQRRSRPFAVLTYRVYAPRVNNGRALRDAASNTAALLDGLF